MEMVSQIDFEEAKKMALDAIAVYLESKKKHNEPIIDDTGVIEDTLSISLA